MLEGLIAIEKTIILVITDYKNLISVIKCGNTVNISAFVEKQFNYSPLVFGINLVFMFSQIK